MKEPPLQSTSDNWNRLFIIYKFGYLYYQLFNRKKYLKMRTVISIILALVMYGSSSSQETCKVLMKELEGQYNGECKKGVANGYGAAKGTDTYIGDFRKGYPHGFGVYTYENGSVYIGSLKKGARDGYGLLNDFSSGAKIMYYGLWV
ncbi:MAG: hypothetical protein R2727_09975, partial [Bacteroidales bacterium]